MCIISFRVYLLLKYNIIFFSVCLLCDCDERCILIGMCCLDLFFFWKVVFSCVDVIIIGDDKRKFYIVLVCREKDFCIDIFLEVRLKNVFVSFMVISYLYEIKVFVEKYENGVILLEWGVEFVCNSLVDFNFILKYLRFIEFV